MSRSPLRFPYMVFAKTRSFLSTYTLSQSGMPAPPPALFPAADPADLVHADVEALPALERAIARHLGVPPERVLATVGASAGMLIAALRWFRPGARVVAETPSYETIRALPDLTGAEVHLLERRLDEGWALSVDRARAALAGADGPAHLFVTNPHNPTGALADADTMVALAAEAERAGGVLVCCEVYMEYVPAERRLRCNDLAPNAVAIGSLTKAYGLGPLRVGWVVLGEGLADEREALRDVLHLAYVDPPTPSVRLGLAAFENLESLRVPIATCEREARPHLERFLARPDVDATVPEFGIIAFPRIRDVDDTRALADLAAAEFDVDVVAGEHFGLPGHLRVACGVPGEVAREGFERLGQAVDSFRARA